MLSRPPVTSRTLEQARQPSPSRASHGVASDRSGLNAILNPRSVAVIGATERAGSVGAAVMRNLLDGQFRGPIYAVNPNRKLVFDRPSLATIANSPAPVDLAIVCTPAAMVRGIVRECGEAGVGGMLILSAGFREVGADGLRLENALGEERARFGQMRIIGPNCFGLIVPSLGLNATFARTSARSGGIAFLSQSGALCAAILGWANDEGIGFSHFVSVGNMLDVGFGDLLDALADDPQVNAIVLYVEAITDAARFVAASQRCTRRKPVIVYKAGRSAVAAKAAASHTGALAGEDAVYQAAFDECGIVRLNRLDDLLSTAELLGRVVRDHGAAKLAAPRWPHGPRLGIITNAGGPGVIAADALVGGAGMLAQLSSATMKDLNALLPPCWSHGNPVDVIGDAPPQRLASALEMVVRDDNVDAALVIVTPQAMIDVRETARAVVQVAAHAAKPILAAWMGGSLAREGTTILERAGIPTYDTPEQAVDAFGHLAVYARRARRNMHHPHPAPLLGPDERMRLHDAAARFLERKVGTLSEIDSKSLLSAYGVACNDTIAAHSRDEAIATAQALGYPVVLKVLSPDITHKTDVGGVRLDLRHDNDVAAAFDQIQQSLGTHRPDAQFEGVTVQRMHDRSCGLELIVGAKRDATFGPVVLVGAGGIAAEVMNDRAIGLAPVTTQRAHDMIRSLRIRPLLESFRGRGALHIDALADAIVRMSHLIADCSQRDHDHANIQAIEANPVVVSPTGVVALDARVIMGAENAID